MAKEADSQAQLDALKGTKATSFLVGADVAAFLAENSSGFDDDSVIWQSPLKKIAPLPESWIFNPIFSFPGGRACATIPISETFSLYGTGLVKGKLKRNNSRIPLWNTDNFSFKRDGGKRLYSSHPWVLGLRPNGSAFGIIADFSWRGEIVLTRNKIHFISDGPPFPVVIIDKNSPQEVMSALRELTGPAPLPPIWTLGYHQCRFSYESETRLRSIAKEFSDRKIPCDALWVDIDSMDNYKTLTINSKTFPNPVKLTSELREQGFHSVWMINPGVKCDSSNTLFASGTTQNVWVNSSIGKPFTGNVWPGPCQFPDFIDNKVKKWWSTNVKKFILSIQMDGIWNDMNEPATFSGPDGTLPVDAQHSKGSHLKFHNIYGIHMIQATRDAFLSTHPNRRPFVLSRSNFLGGHRFGACWTGDNISSKAHMKLSIPMSLNLALSGMSFNGPDLGGFTQNCSKKLFAEWISFGAFFPFCRGHADKYTNNKEPWAFGKEVEDFSRIALLRRYRLLPYLYTLFFQLYNSGQPILQPAFFADHSLTDEDEIFLLGPNLLVIPPWVKNKSSLVKFSNWKTIFLLDQFQETKLSEFSSQTDWSEENQAELRLRPGSILPTCDVCLKAADSLSSPLTLYIAPNTQNCASGELYEDDGTSSSYETGDFSLREFSAKITNGEIHLSSKLISGKRTPISRPISPILCS